MSITIQCKLLNALNAINTQDILWQLPNKKRNSFKGLTKKSFVWSKQSAHANGEEHRGILVGAKA